MPGRKPLISFLISAEHAGKQVPQRWQALFARQQFLLDSHRGWDPGSGELARALAAPLNAPLLEGEITRLLIDLNRSPAHPLRFPAFSRGLAPAQKRELIERYWQPHWDRYGEYLETLPGQIIHIACHSFTPVLDGRSRSTDIGLLYDPSRLFEADYCRRLGSKLRAALPGLKVHMNRPYRGVSNGMGQQHRRYHDDRRLITFELEVNQRLTSSAEWKAMRETIVETIRRNAS
ncbi:MAG: N-formylglutamate amidohydrolase [Wenzhouxiangellaceae bacterium]|nr:N-formylglutamate amidohydrolase [Wenzhouxiangellaceae bacterium]